MKQLTDTEFRIGNKIQDNKYPDIFSTIAEIREDFVITNYSDKLKDVDISAIPTTSDLLLSSGFTVRTTSDPEVGNASKAYTLGSFEIEQPNEVDDYFIFNWGKGTVELKWFHQVQNLFADLMGKELTIKL